jgi:hypothetical protein
MQHNQQTMNLTPQARTVLSHLINHGSLTQAEAGTVYRIRALPRRIADLKEIGYQIRKEHRKDATGQRYVRYFLDAKEPIEVKPEAPAQKETPVLREGARIRVVRPWMAPDYERGHEGVVISPVERPSGQRNGRGFRVQFDHLEAGDTNYVTENEVEVIA